MKIKITHLILPYSFFLLSMQYSVGQTLSNSDQDKKLIIGSWLSEDDNSWKLAFTSNNHCNEYINNVLSNTYTFVISNTTPQCGIDVYMNINTEYLQIKNENDSTDIRCYLIYGVTDKSLSISPLGIGSAFIFDKQ